MLLGASTFLLNSLLVRNLISNLKNRSHLKSRMDVEAPTVLKGLTLALPLKNEAANLKKFLPLLERQHSQPEKILFLIDESTDETETYLRNFQKHFSKSQVKILSSLPRAPKYQKKVWALKQLLDHVETEFVLFMDADVKLSHPRALFSVFEEAFSIRKGRYSFATVFPRAKAREDISLLVNQVFVQLYYFLPSHWKGPEFASLAAGWGQVIFVNAPKLREYRFLDSASNSTNIGLKLARLFKEKEKCVSYFDGGALFQSEYYSSLSKAFKGLTKKTFENGDSPLVVFSMSILMFWAFVLPFVLLPFAIINPWWFGALFVILWGQYRLMQELDLNLLFIAATPITASLSCLVQLWGMLNKEAELKLMPHLQPLSQT